VTPSGDLAATSYGRTITGRCVLSPSCRYDALRPIDAAPFGEPNSEGDRSAQLARRRDRGRLVRANATPTAKGRKAHPPRRRSIAASCSARLGSARRISWPDHLMLNRDQRHRYPRHRILPRPYWEPTIRRFTSPRGTAAITRLYRTYKPSLAAERRNVAAQRRDL